MAEIVGIAASAVTFAAIFSNCVECFSYFKAAQNCPEDVATLLVKLDCEKARLLIWADNVGVFRSTAGEGRRPQLDDPACSDLLRRCFFQIADLLTDAHKLQAEYGSGAVTQHESSHSLEIVSTNSMGLFRAKKARFFASVGGPVNNVKLVSRIKWAIRDGAKFRTLVLSLREFVDNVFQLVPVTVSIVNTTVEQDITTILDIEHLELTKVACEDDYPAWSAKASEIIRESEIGTLDRRSLQEVLRDTNEVSEARNLTPTPLTDVESAVVGMFAGSFLISTPCCLGDYDDSLCGRHQIGEAILERNDITFNATTNRWDLGERIMDHVQTPKEVVEAIKTHENMVLEAVKLGEDKPVKFFTRAYIYCGPCAYAISTAIGFIDGLPTHEYIDFVIRVSDRLPTSCRRHDSIADVLVSIHSSLEEYDANYNSMSQTLDNSLDCPYLETRLYCLENEHGQTHRPMNAFQQLALDKDTMEGGPGNKLVIVIVENDEMQRCFSAPPFRLEARQPRQTEIYRVTKNWDVTLRKLVLQKNYIGTYRKSGAAKTRDDGSGA